MFTKTHNPAKNLDKGVLMTIAKIWWPLAASWIMMAAEQPVMGAIIARLPQPEINLAAYGGIVFPIALIIEAPIIMLLSASVALSKDMRSFQKIHKFMMISGFLLTGLHLLIAATPLYYFVTEKIIGAPAEIIEPARWGLIALTPWTWSIGYRRFYQGVLIRYGHSDAVGIGTIIRITSITGIMFVGYFTQGYPGVVLAGFAQGLAVLLEAIYAGYRGRRVVRCEIAREPLNEELSWGTFYRYYIPLAMTSFITMLWSPISSMALSRLPSPLESLAIWPVLNGTIFLFRSFGIAFNEVVVALLDKKGMSIHLRHFAKLLILVMTVLLVLISFTPVVLFWFETIFALPPAFAELAVYAFRMILIIPCLVTLQSWYQGAILYGKKTQGIPEANGLSLLAAILVFVIGYFMRDTVGLYIGMAAYLMTNLVQVFWLWIRSRPIMAEVNLRDQTQ